MSRLKGKTEIILTDVNTGEVERYVEENMLTGALNDVYNGNPYGLLSNNHVLQSKYTGTHDTSLRNTTGGVLLFPNTVEENVTHFYESATNYPTAYASNDAYSGTDTRRGSFDAQLSKPVTRGYQYVWNFGISQGNGQISCVSLTHFKGARDYLSNYTELVNYGQTDESNTYCYGELGNVEHPVARKIKTVLAFTDEQLVCIDKDNKIGVIKCKANSLNYDSFFNSSKFVEKMSAPNCNFITAGGEFYTFTATATTITWQKYNIDCEQIESGAWSFSGTNFYTTNGRYVFAKAGNYVYMIKAGSTSVYKLNIVNRADVTEIAATAPATTNGVCLRSIGAEIFTRNGIIGADDVFRASPITLSILPFRRYGVWLLGYSDVNFSSSNNYNSLGRSLQTNYLATINNLSKPVTKDSSKTMMIVYTLTEAE